MKCGRVIRVRQLPLLGGGKRILGCSCNEAVRGDLGIDTLQGCRG